MGDEYVEVSIDILPLGQVLSFPVLQENELLLAEGTVITSRVVELLHLRGIDSIKMHPRDAAQARDSTSEQGYSQPIEAPSQYYRVLDPRPREQVSRATLHRSVASRRLDDQIAARTELTRRPGAGRVYLRSRPIPPVAERRQRLAQRKEQEELAIARLDVLQRESMRRGRFDVGPWSQLVETQLLSLCADPDTALFIESAPSAIPYPARHCWWVCRLAMALAATLDWSREEIVALGLGALAHDVGMLRLPDKLYRSKTRIGSIERHDLAKHPIFALDLIRDSDLPEEVYFVVYQTHERGDGMGYPRGRRTPQIHPAARLTGLADAYIAMVSHRLHRNPLLPHLAMLEVIQETQAGQWDPMVTRALLKLLSLYPLGSFVELSDGRLARSIRLFPTDHRRPMVEAWDDPASIAHEPGRLVDLQSQSNLLITRAISCPQELT